MGGEIEGRGVSEWMRVERSGDVGWRLEGKRGGEGEERKKRTNENLLDVGRVGQEHDESIDTHSPTGGCSERRRYQVNYER